MANNTLLKMAILGLISLGALMADVQMALAQDYDFGRRRIDRLNAKLVLNQQLDELLREAGDVLDEIRAAEFDREQGLLDAVNDAAITDIEEAQERNSQLLDNELEFELAKREIEQEKELEALRNGTAPDVAPDFASDAALFVDEARDTQQTLVDTYCDVSAYNNQLSTPSAVQTCKDQTTIAQLPSNYQMVFYSLFPEYAGVSPEQADTVAANTFKVME